MESIEIIGENAGEVNLRFHVGDNLASKCGDFMWFGPLKRIQKLFFHTPLVKVFVGASDFYHDKAWWPKHGQMIHDEWRKSSPWGQLWDTY